MRLAVWLVALLVSLGPLVFLVWALLSPPLQSYHPFHPNHPHLPSAYRADIGSPSYRLSELIAPASSIEGWYLKLRTASGRHFAIIYLYFVSADPRNSTAAVTLLDAQSGQSHLFQTPIEQFTTSPLPNLSKSLRYLFPSHSDIAAPSSSPYHDFELRVGNNTMSPYHVSASLRADGQSEAWVSADVELRLERPKAAEAAAVPSGWLSALSSRWSTVFSPASHTVGVFAFLPLACYQQVIELQLAVSGHMTLDGQLIDFDGATGYYEKTRGSTFPDNYLWIHAAHFQQLSDTAGQARTQQSEASSLSSSSSGLLSSFFFSLASVPIQPTSLRLPGFVCSFVLDGRSWHFATQLGSVLTALTIDDRVVEFALYDQHFTTRVTVTASRHPDPIEEDSWLWAARNGHLRRVIPQRIGKDSVHVTMQHIQPPGKDHDDSNSRSGHAATESSTASDTGALDADSVSFTSRGYSLSEVFSSHSDSVGLEVYVHASELQQQVGVMYADVRPWLAHRYFPFATPLVSFSISATFVRSLLPETIRAVSDRVGIKHTLLIGCLSLLAIVVTLILLSLPCSSRHVESRKVKAE